MNIPTANASARLGDPIAQPLQPRLRTEPEAAPRLVDDEYGTAPTNAESDESLLTELAAANLKLANGGNELRFEYDRDASRLIVRLVDLNTREVLRQFPSDDALRAARLIKSGKPLISMQA